jgi:hypothetical protein
MNDLIRVDLIEAPVQIAESAGAQGSFAAIRGFLPLQRFLNQMILK